MKIQKIPTVASATVGIFEVTGQNYNSQFFTIYSLNYTFFNFDFRNNIFIILAADTKYYFRFIGVVYIKPLLFQVTYSAMPNVK